MPRWTATANIICAALLSFFFLLGSAAAESGPLIVITRDTTAIGGPAIEHATSWTAHGGMKVKVVRLPFDQLYSRILVPVLMGVDSFDVLLIPSGWIGDLGPFLAPVPESIRGMLKPKDILPPYRDLGRVPSGGYVAVPIDGDMHIGTYRVDLFTDPSTREAYRRETGYELDPPTTWEDYLRVAAFFNRRKGPDGRSLHGTAEAFQSSGQRIWTFFSHAASYVVHQNVPGGMFFDPDTMVPAIDSAGWVRALKEYIQAREYAGPDAARLSSADVRRLFGDGEAAMAIDWTDIGPLAVGSTSELTGEQVGFFALPGSRDCWNPIRGAWDHYADVWRVPFLAFGGWVAAVPASSPHVEDAWNYVAWLASPAASIGDVTNGYSGINPYRFSHLSDPDVWRAVMPRRAADAYLGVLRDALAAPVVAQDLRLPGTEAYLESLDREIGRALDGEISPEEALRVAAAEWDFLTDRLGRGAQRRHYRTAMGLPE